MVPTTSGWPAWPMSRISQALLVVPGGLDMHLEDQRAGGIEHEHVALLGGRRDRFGDPVCRKDHGLVGLWYVVQFFHKNGTFGLQGINDKSIVNNLMAHVDGGAIFGQSQFDDLDGPVDAGAEPARGRKVNGEGRPGRALWWGGDGHCFPCLLQTFCDAMRLVGVRWGC